MKKSLIAAAVTAVIAAPAAMADITMGGQLQLELIHVSGDGTAQEGVHLVDGWEGDREAGGAGAWFVKGEHDLGNGLKALWKLNTGISADAGHGIGTRDTFIGLSGGFGTVLLGRLNSAYKSSTVKWDPFLATFMQARGNNGMTAAGHNGYVNDVVAYANKFGPVTLVAAIGLDESDDLDADDNAGQDGELDGDHAATVSINAPVGPVELALAWVDTGGIGGGVEGTDDVEAIKAGVKFSTGAFTAAAQYETVDVGGEDAFDNAFITGSFKAGKNTFSLSYGQVMPDADTDNDDPTYIALGAKHAFNKKVSTLIGVTQSTNDDGIDATGDDDNMRAGISTRIKF